MSKMRVPPADPLTDPAADLAQRATCRALTATMGRVGLDVPDDVLAWVTPNDLPPDVATYALADGAGLLPHDANVLAKMGADELTAELAKLTADQIAYAAERMDDDQRAQFVGTLKEAGAADDVLAAAEAVEVKP